MSRHDAQRLFWPRVAREAKYHPAQPTEVLDSYWRLAAERQAIFFRRLEGQAAPWTDDAILREYKFTNAYRASDRVSQYLIRNVIYDNDQSVVETFFRIILFKLFNKIETWELLTSALGTPRYDVYDFREYDRVLTAAMATGRRIYSAAYIMPTGGRESGKTRKHRSHLKLLETMMTDQLPERIASAASMNEVFKLLRQYPMVGDFLAYQYVTDINYSEITRFSESEFVVAGPGAIDGISKCFRTLGGLSEAEVIKMVASRQEDEFERLGIKFRSLWGRPLQYIDCQNLFCEISKYARVSHPHLRGKSGRTRIKQRFRPNRENLSVWYPPKWGINDLIPRAQEPALQFLF